MNTSKVQAQDSVFKHILWLYGLYTLLFNVCFVFSYYLLPKGFMRGSPQTAVGEIVASAESFWPQFGLTLLFNLGIMTTIAVVAVLLLLELVWFIVRWVWKSKANQVSS